MDTITPYLANNKYRASLRSTWIASPADTTLAVDAVPSNFPTLVTVGWGTSLQTTFSADGYSGDSPSNYTLTGVTRIRGANQNLPQGTAVNCLNSEEFFNQYGEAINDVIETVNESVPVAGITTVADASTMNFNMDSGKNRVFKCSPTDNRTFTLSNAIVGLYFTLEITQPASAKTITWFTGFTITWKGGTTGATATDILATKKGTYIFLVTSASTLDGWFTGSN